MYKLFLILVSILNIYDVYTARIQKDTCPALQQCYNMILNYTENVWSLSEVAKHTVACQKNEEFLVCYETNVRNCQNFETLKQARIKKKIMAYICSDEGSAGLYASSISNCINNKKAVKRANDGIAECASTFKKEVSQAKAENSDFGEFHICPYAEDLMNCVFDSTSRHCRVGYATVVVKYLEISTDLSCTFQPR